MNGYRVINAESAATYVADVGDPIISTIMDMIGMRIMLKYSCPSDHSLEADLDLRFLTEVLVEFFSDRELIMRVLAGEKPGAWDEEQSESL